MSVQPLFTPVRIGDLDLPNRIVMAPLTRMRAGSIDHVPTALQASGRRCVCAGASESFVATLSMVT